MGRIKVTPTRTGIDGSGYYRGADGKYYYGNPRNGYVTETIQSQKAREDRLQAERDAYNEQHRPYPRPAVAPPTQASFIESLLLAIITTVLLFRAIAALAVGFVLMFGVIAWPWYINMLAGFYMSGRGDWSVILMTVILIAVIGYYAFCVREVLVGKGIRSRRFMIVCTGTMVAPFVVYGVIMHDLGQITSNGLWGIVLGVIPALVLTYLEHRAAQEVPQGVEWFGFRVARLVTRVCPFGSLGMFVLGAVMFAIAVAGLQLLQSVMTCAMFTVLGLIMILIGLVPMMLKKQ